MRVATLESIQPGRPLIAASAGPQNPAQGAPKPAFLKAQHLKRVAVVGSFPPRLCGIATFTQDVANAVQRARPDLDCGVFALEEPGETRPHPAAVAAVIRQDVRADYLAAARRINGEGYDVVCLQHEYGIFGGEAGEHVLTLAGALRRPLVTTLHTLLAEPSSQQKHVLQQLAEASETLIVMAEKGRSLLRRVYGVGESKIVIVPHGAPDMPFSDGLAEKARLGVAGRKVVLTFGLLSPNKGIESVIRALPDIVAAAPDTLYVVLGATHPHLVARQGEAYRDGLTALARDLGVEAHLRFVNEYASDETLIAWLAAADVYVTPYLQEAQVTSGTLSYALALGKAVVSTPFWHAREALADGRGVLAGFNDSKAFALEITRLLTDDQSRMALRRRAYAATRETTWPRVAERYLRVFEQARTAPAHVPALPPPSVAATAAMTDGCGMLQHSIFHVPDRAHGYCLDDNARALMLTYRLDEAGFPAPNAAGLRTLYAAFVQHAFNPDTGSFRNFMSFERRWLEPQGSPDSCARGLWALGLVRRAGAQREERLWAEALFNRAWPFFAGDHAPRTQAFVILAVAEALAGGSSDAALRADLQARAQGLRALLHGRENPDWVWFEPFLSYDNARLPEALIRAGMALQDRDLMADGVETLAWLTRRQTGEGGVFRPVGTASFADVYAEPAAFDQQPLEAAATIDACAAAFAATRDASWLDEARRAYGWFLGENDHGLALAAPQTGVCRDGLTPDGLNLNQGAESVLSFALATCSMHVLERAALDQP